MYEEVNKDRFHAAFKEMGRQNQFSFDGLDVLFDYLEEQEEEGPGVELDVISICCDFVEYENIEDYGEAASIEELSDATTVIPLSDGIGFIIANF